VNSTFARFGAGVVVVMGLAVAAAGPFAQQLLDHVVARVNGSPVFLSDVRAAVGFGLIEAGPEGDQTRQMVRRQVLLTEVGRFPPPEPAAADVAAELARMKARVRDAAAFQREQGLSDQQVQGMARDSLRIDAYLTQRFGATRPRDAVEQWMKELEARADVVLPRSP
jgi:hypothetical protein